MTDEDEENDDNDDALQQPEIISDGDKSEPPKSTELDAETEKPNDDVPFDTSNTGQAKKRPAEDAKSKDIPAKVDAEPTSVAVGETEVVLPVKKPKIDRTELVKQMFTKRTAGGVFEEARKRYLERKALREI